ncbi:DUF1149 family protein [Lactococcus lactis]
MNNKNKDFIIQIHYDARNYEWEKENGTPETNLNVQFQLVPKEQLEKLGEGDTGIHAVLTYLIVLDNIVLSGFVSQLNYVRGQIIKEQEEQRFHHPNSEDIPQYSTKILTLLHSTTS